ncbi:hypothetical protein CEE37_00140 [candidate division LCP-89 bacterium B3_LCP]|uniref:Uncharacterized protein n=1 Tax=candidate division LCP-89 bacterium B3_LCP TaxID=2012998 RepID=A0A532V4J4_UNCL8|nr:MAG: hypothetical protein CEE37_00140 [candidate division LCP-89 bacterium B3_LCP]
MPKGPLDGISPIPADTTLEAYRFQIAVLRRIGPEGRMKLMSQLCRGMRRTVEDGVRMRHPEYDDETVKLAVIRLTAGREVFDLLLPNIEVKP